MQPLRVLLLFPLAVSVAATHIDKSLDQAATIEETVHQPHSHDERALVERDTSGILLACITGAGAAFQAYAGCYLTAFRNDPRTLTLRMDRTRGGGTSNVLVILSGGALSQAVHEVVQIVPGAVRNIATLGASTIQFLNNFP
nr:secreted in xylem 8a4 [Fusarium oxysporum f. sp. sesami]